MKAFKYILAGAAMVAAAVGVSSCTDLEEHPYTFIAPSTYYTNEAELNTELTATYNRFRRIYSANNQLYLAQIELMCEQGWPTYNKNDMEIINKWASGVNNPSGNGALVYVWNSVYECINRANIVLGRVDGLPMSEESANRMKGQSLFMRGYAAFHLLRLFGGVPIPTTYTKGVDGLECERLSVDDTYKQIISDLEEAVKLLPQRGAAGYDVWRASKGAAQAALSEVCLYHASMIDADKTAYLQKAYDNAKAVIDSKIYSLMDNYTDQFYWFNEAGAKNCAESVFELQYAPTDGQNNDMHIRFGLGRTNNAYMGTYQYARMGVSAFVYEEMVKNNDKRANVFLTYYKGNGNGAQAADTEHNYDLATYSWIPEVTNDRNTVMNAVFNCKYFDQHTPSSLNKPCANFPLLRYSEVLLNAAEAANLLGKSGEAKGWLDEVRDRAGVTNAYTDIDEEIFQQRRYEFVGEGKVFFEELRRGVLGKYAAEKIQKGYEKHIAYFDTDKIVFRPSKSFLFKIPQKAMDSNKALEQNPDNVEEK